MPWQESIATQAVTKLGYAPDIGIVGRKNKVYSFDLHDSSQRIRNIPSTHGKHIVTVGLGFLQNERAVVTADDHQRRGSRLEAADQVVAGRPARFQNQHPSAQGTGPVRSSRTSVPAAGTFSPPHVKVPIDIACAWMLHGPGSTGNPSGGHSALAESGEHVRCGSGRSPLSISMFAPHMLLGGTFR